MATMTFKANLIPASNTSLELGKSGSNNANYWSNIYANIVTLSQDPTNNLEAATKQYVDNKVGNEAFEIPVLVSSDGWYIPSTIKGTDILNHIDNCYLMIDGYGRTEINNYLIDSSSPPGPNIQLFAKAYDDVFYFGTEYKMFKVTAAGNSTNTPTVDAIDFTQTMDGDRRVYQSYSTTNASYPLLLTSISGITNTSSRGAYGAILNNNIYANPSTGTVTATTFSGTLSGNATTATKLSNTPNNTTTYLRGDNSWQTLISSGNSALAWNSEITLATVGGTTIKAKLPVNPNTDTLVKQTAKSDNVNYKLLMGANSSPTSGTAYEAVYDTAITVNPSTDTITATNFAGNATTATTATNLSTAPSLTTSGNNITVTAGGKTSSAFTVPYATSAGVLNYGSSVTTDDAINNFLEASKLKVALWTSTSSPGQNNGILISGAYSSTSYGFQLAIDDDPTYYMALRQKGSSSGWSAWKQIPMGDGTGASGTWGISITGNAATATKATQDGSGNIITSTYVKKSGDTMTGYLTYKDPTIDASKANNNVSSIQYPTTFNILDSQERIITRQEAVVTSDGNIAGYWYVRNYNTSGESLGTQGIQIIMNKSGELTTEIRNSKKLTIDKNSCIQRNAISSSWLSGRTNALTYLNTSDGYSTLASIKTTNGTWSIGHYTSWADSLLWIYLADSRTENNYDARAYLTSAGEYHASKVWGAVYNDYAEMRNVPEAQNEDNPLRPGTCVREVGDGTMIPTTERLQRGCKVVSDTFGFNIGETDDCKTPIAVSGRALVYLDQDCEVARDYIGWPVCSGPNGTVSIMTEEEEEKYPSRIVGTISEIPDYEKWGSSNVEVNGRIWIYVK